MQKTKFQQRGIHATGHYALWADSCITTYMYNEFLKDGSAATKWAKINKPLFDDLAEELKLRDPATFIKIKGTL